MNDEQKDRQWFKKIVQNEEKKRKWSFHYVLLLGCVGIALMIVGNLLTNSPEENVSSMIEEEGVENKAVFKSNISHEEERERSSMEEYEMHYENQLKEVLEQIIGVSDVSVMINLAETERYVYEKNKVMRKQTTDETDREGGTRKVEDVNEDEQIVIIRNGDKEEPILLQKEKPTIRGVLVVAKGVENQQIKSWVVEAVSRVLDVPSHRVSVMPKKTKEE